MTRQYSWPDGHWGWPVKLTHKHGVRAGNYLFTGGQADLDTEGRVQNPNSLEPQVRNVTHYLFDILQDLGAVPTDLVRLVVYFVGDAEVENKILQQIAELIGPEAHPVVNTVPMPALCYPGMLIELEGVAMKSRSNTDLERHNIRLDNLPALPSPFSHAVRCGGIVFTSDLSARTSTGAVSDSGDIVAQTDTMMAQLGVALNAAGAHFDDVLKLNTFYVGDGTAENWEQPALIRQARFQDPGPAATGITLPALAHDGLVTKIAATAVSTGAPTAGTPSPSRQYSWPDGHWDWTAKLPYKHGNRCGDLIHLGGQVSLDSYARVIDPNDIVAQTHRAIENIKIVLADFGATLDHVVKVTTFYQGDASAEALHQNLNIRSQAFTEPGPATSGIPVPCLVYEHMCVEIEVIAVLD